MFWNSFYAVHNEVGRNRFTVLACLRLCTPSIHANYENNHNMEQKINECVSKSDIIYYCL